VTRALNGAVLALILAGCASTSSIPLPGSGDPKAYKHFRHPATGDLQRCERGEWGWTKGVWDVIAYDKCRDTLEAKGYRFEPQYPDDRR
jgi:hypothetical protein